MSKKQYIEAINKYLEMCDKKTTLEFIFVLLRKTVKVGEMNG